MPWKFGGNFRQVEAACAYNWMECPRVLIDYIWTEVVTDVADCLANEIILWRVLATLLIVAALCKLIFWQKKWTKEVKKHKRNLNLVCSKLQDLDLKINVLNYKVQYGTLPLSYISKNAGIDFRDIHLTSSHLNENNSWVKYFLESLSDNGLKKEDHLTIKSLFDAQPKLSISDFNDQNINQTNIFSNLEENNDLEEEMYIAYKNSKTKIQKNQIENSANSSSPKFQLERKLSAMDWSVVSSRHSLTDLTKQKYADSAFNACLNTIRKNGHMQIVEPKKDIKTSCHLKMPQTEIQTSEIGCFENTTITNNNNISSDKCSELYVVPQNTVIPSDSIIFHIQDETILSNSLPNNIDLEGDLYHLKEELREIQSTHRNCYSIDSWLSAVITSTNIENISNNDSNKVDIKPNKFSDGVNFSELNNQSSNNYKVDHDLQNSTDNASNLVNTCTTYNKIVMKGETPVQFDEIAKNEDCVTFRERIESIQNQDIVQKETLNVCVKEKEGNQNTKEGNNNALMVEVNNCPENIISINNILLSTSRENISILQKSNINESLKDMDDDRLTTLLMQEVIRYRKELSIQIESRESYNYIDNQNVSFDYQPKTLDMITEESSASSCTDKPSKTYILEEDECVNENEIYSREPNFERCEFVDKKEIHSKEPNFEDKNENIYFDKYYTVEVSASKIQISSSSNNQEINNPAESKESIKSICLTTNIEDLYLRKEASTRAISEVLETCFSSKTENNIDMFTEILENDSIDQHGGNSEIIRCNKNVVITEILENDSIDQHGGDSKTTKCNKNTKNIVITEILENDSTDQYIGDSETTKCNNTKNIVITDPNNKFSDSVVNKITDSSDLKSDENIKHILASSSYLSNDKTLSSFLETEPQCRSLKASDLKSEQVDIGDFLSRLVDSENLKSEIEFQEKECSEKILSSCETVKHISENKLFENKEVECSSKADIFLEKLTVEEEVKGTDFNDEKLDNDNISLQNNFHINDEAESSFKSTNTVTNDNVLHNNSLSTLIEIKPEIQNKNEESIKINNEIISENETLNNFIENDCDVRSKLIALEMKNQETLENTAFDSQNQSEQQKKITISANATQEDSVDKCIDMDSENHREKIIKIDSEGFCNNNKKIVPELQSQSYNCDVVQTCDNTKNIEKNISLLSQSGNSNEFLRILKPKNHSYHVFCKASNEYQYHQGRKQPEKRIQKHTCINLNKITSKSTSELNSNNRCNLASTGKSNVGSVNRRSKSYATPRNISLVQNDKTEIQRLSKSLERSSKSSLKSQKQEIPNTDKKKPCESKRENIRHFTESPRKSSPRIFILRNSKELTNDKKHEAKSNRFSNSLPSSPKNIKHLKEIRSNTNYESRSNSSFTSLPSSPRLCYSKNLKEVISDKKIKSKSSISFNQFSPRDTSFCNRNSKLDLKIPNESQIPSNKSVSKSCIPVLKNRSEIIKPIEHALNAKSFVRGPLTISTNRYKENKKEVVNKSVLEKDEQSDKFEQNETIDSNLCTESNLPSKETISENIFSRSEELESNVIKETEKNKNLSFKLESKEFSGICMPLETKNIIESPKSKFSLLLPKSQRENKFFDNSSSTSCKETQMLLKPATLNSSTSTLNLID